MSDLPYNATVRTFRVNEYNHLKEPLRSSWIECLLCHQVPSEIGYKVHIPMQVQGNLRSWGGGSTFCSEPCTLKWLAEFTPRFQPVEEMESTLLPTQDLKRGWMDCFRKTGSYPPDTERSGKWLIWLSPDTIDRYWIKIKQAVHDGRLGDWAKVSTAGSLSEQRPRYVICVYTYDYENEADVMRIREVLRELGIRREIRYKPDEDTNHLRYGSDYEASTWRRK